MSFPRVSPWAENVPPLQGVEKAKCEMDSHQRYLCLKANWYKPRPHNARRGGARSALSARSQDGGSFCAGLISACAGIFINSDNAAMTTPMGSMTHTLKANGAPNAGISTKTSTSDMNKHMHIFGLSSMALLLAALCTGCGYLGGVDSSAETSPGFDFSNYKRVIVEGDINDEDRSANINVAVFFDLQKRFEVKDTLSPKDIEKTRKGDLYIKVKTEYGFCLPPLFGITHNLIPIFDFFPADKVTAVFLDGETKKEVMKYVYLRGVFSCNGYPSDLSDRIHADLKAVNKEMEAKRSPAAKIGALPK